MAIKPEWQPTKIARDVAKSKKGESTNVKPLTQQARAEGTYRYVTACLPALVVYQNKSNIRVRSLRSLS